jgi:hypothetical protein
MTGLPAAATLEGFARATDAIEGVNVRDLEPLTRLFVRTCNSEYQIVVSAGGEVLVEGGRFFHRPTPAVLEGASLGGSFLKVGWIAVGLRMEIRDASRRIVTSPVLEIVTGAWPATVH